MKTSIRVIFAILLLASLSFAGLPNGYQWDLRTTGNDNNGGAFLVGSTGTDRSQSDSAFCTASDLVLVTADTATSATCPFSSTSVGNLIHVTAGTNFTVQRCAVFAVISVTATLQCEGIHAGTSGATGGTFFLGGAALTPQSVVTSLAGAAYHTVYVKTGTYTVTSAITFPADVLGATFEGYVSTHGDLTYATTLSASAPLWTTSTNSISLVSYGAGSDSPAVTFREMVFSTTAGTRGHGFYPNTSRPSLMLRLDRCKLSGFDYGVDGDFSGGYFFTNLFIWKTEFTGHTQVAVRNGGANWIVGNNFHDNVGDAYNELSAGYQQPNTLIGNIFNHNNTSSGGQGSAVWINTGQGGGLPGGLFAFNNVFYNNVKNSLNISGGSNQYVVINNIFDSNAQATTTALVSTNLNADNTLFTQGNVYRNNDTNISCVAPSPPTGYICTDSTDIFPSVSPFTNAAGGDFSLNNTAGGGALLKATGFMGVLPLSGTGYADIGPLQSQSATSGSGNAAFAQ